VLRQLVPLKATGIIYAQIMGLKVRLRQFWVAYGQSFPVMPDRKQVSGSQAFLLVED